jgi:hypothetical protein
MMQLVVSCIFFSGFLYSIQFYLCFLKKISINHGIIAGLLIFFLCFIYDTGSNVSITGNEKARLMRENNIKPGTDEWFKLWFSRPYLTGEKPV